MNEGRAQRLGTWLAPRIGASGEVTISEAGGPSAIGYSAETVILEAAYSNASGEQLRKFVLRAETPERPIYPSQGHGIDVEIEIQRRVMESVRVASNGLVPLAAVVGHDPTDAAIGTPFFLMDPDDGHVPPVDPPYPVAGFFTAASPGARRSMVDHGVEVLAYVHGVDWQAHVPWLVPSGASTSAIRQLDLWEDLARTELGDRHHPGIARGLEQLRRHLPSGSQPVLCWGDPRLGNMIFRDGRCVCVTDWEAACVAPPEFDVGWWLMFDHSCHEAAGVERLDGEPTRDEQLARYNEVSGRALRDLQLWEMFAALRYAAIAVRVLNRLVDRGLMPEDHPFWLENPATTCLDLQLER